MTHAPQPATTRPRHTIVWTSIGVILALVVVGVPVGLFAGERAAVAAYASDDADRLTIAHISAQNATATFDDAVELATAHLDTVATPIKAAADAHVAEFGQEPIDALTERIGVLQQAMAVPTSHLGGQPGDGAPSQEETAQLTAATGSTETATEPTETATEPTETADADPTADTWAYAIEALADGPDDIAVALRDHYLGLEDMDRFQARAALNQEVARFEQLRDLYSQSTTSLQEAVDAVDESIRDLVLVAGDVGPATIGELEYSTDETIEALQNAIDAFETITDIELPVAWETRTLEQPAPFVGVTDAVDTYVASAAAARTSHTDNTPRATGGGGGGGPLGYACFRWSPYGSYLAWCLW